MAIATSAAIGLGISAVSAGMSFAQASKQKKIQNQAQADAQKAMDEARKRLEPNYYAALSVQKEPHELAREALNVQGAQAIQAGAESERGAAATAGRVQAQMNTAQQEERNDYGKELTDLAKLTAGEDSRLRDVNVQLDLEEVAGQQQMASDAQQAAAAATAAGMASATSAIQQGIAGADLYSKNKSINPLAQPNAGKVSVGAAGTPGGPSNYVMQDQQNKAVNPSQWFTPNALTTSTPYNPYAAANPFLFYQNPGIGGQ